MRFTVVNINSSYKNYYTSLLYSPCTAIMDKILFVQRTNQRKTTTRNAGVHGLNIMTYDAWPTVMCHCNSPLALVVDPK